MLRLDTRQEAWRTKECTNGYSEGWYKVSMKENEKNVSQVPWLHLPVRNLTALDINIMSQFN